MPPLKFLSSIPNPRIVCSRAHTVIVVHARATKFRPCIDIHKGNVKQIVGGSLKDNAAGESSAVENFVSDRPSSYYSRLYAGDDLQGGHVIMLGADDASVATAREALGAWPGGLQLGGGVISSNAMQWIDAGASHVIVTSYVFTGGQLRYDRLDELVDMVGTERLVLDLSCRKRDGRYYVVTDRWQRFTDFALDAQSVAALADKCAEFLVHGVDVEGMQLGIDAELVELLGKWSPIPVTYAGGARTLEDLELVKQAGCGNVDITVGSALDIFGGRLPYSDVVKWHREQAAAGL